ncbi:hypothetical protein K3335_003774 [Salmonella enterica]|nr:hypothetical protein [Salmonella enterica]
MANQITPAQTFNKFSTEIVLKEYIPNYGWTDACVCTDVADAKQRIKDYRAEGLQVKTARRRVLNKDAFLCQALLNFCCDYYRNTGGLWPNEVEVLKSNGKVKFTLTLKEIEEVLGNDCRLVTLQTV